MQTSSNVYLTFNGNCREAMNFYHACLGGNLEIMEFGNEVPNTPESLQKNVMHACLSKEGILVMASDTFPENPVSFGNNFSISINCVSREEADLYFKNLSAEGVVTMPLQDTFWGAYFGMITDKFGVNWMFNYDVPKEG